MSRLEREAAKQFLFLLPLMCALLLVRWSAPDQFVRASTVRYVAQSAGTFSGGSACNGQTAITVATFNSTTLSPGDTTYFCGTITAPGGSSDYIQISQSGTSGNLLTFIFDTGAVITAPYWQNGGAIYLGGNNYILINGGTNGIIQATANGTVLANHVDGGVGIYSPAAVSNLEVENLTIQNLYVRTSTTDENVDEVYGIDVWGGSNIKYHNLSINNAVWDILLPYGTSSTTSTGILMYNLTLADMDHGAAIGDQGNGSHLTSSNCSSAFYNNDISGMGVWDDTVDADDDYHHDGFHMFANGTSSSYSGFCVVSNYVHGANGADPSGMLTYEAASGGSDIMAQNVIRIDGTTSACADGALAWFTGSGNSGTTQAAYLNTVFADADCNEDIGVQESSSAIMKDNIFMQGPSSYVYQASPTNGLSTADYNFYGTPQGSTPFTCTGNLDVVFATWQSGCGFDSHGQVLAITLNSDSTLPSASPLIGLGVNLTSLGITMLSTGPPQTFGMNGSCGTGCIARPSTGAWDPGAYPFATTTPVNGVGFGMPPL